MNLICVSGLPRSGSTLLCQLLAQHPEVYSTGHSSPLVSVLENIRSTFSSNDFSLAQLDVDFDLAYGQIENVLKSVISGWFSETDKQHVVDKNRGWLRMAEMLNELHEDWRILVCVRDLTQIYGSIESQHAKTRFLNFADGTDAHGAMAHANRINGQDNTIGTNAFGNNIDGAANNLGSYVNFNSINGFSNTVGGGAAGNELWNVNVLGSQNTVGSAGLAGSNVSVIGTNNTVNGAASGWNTITGHNGTVEGTGTSQQAAMQHQAQA